MKLRSFPQSDTNYSVDPPKKDATTGLIRNLIAIGAAGILSLPSTALAEDHHHDGDDHVHEHDISVMAGLNVWELAEGAFAGGLSVGYGYYFNQTFGWGVDGDVEGGRYVVDGISQMPYSAMGVHITTGPSFHFLVGQKTGLEFGMGGGYSMNHVFDSTSGDFRGKAITRHAGAVAVSLFVEHEKESGEGAVKWGVEGVVACTKEGYVQRGAPECVPVPHILLKIGVAIFP